jgi:hypothetical protein
MLTPSIPVWNGKDKKHELLLFKSRATIAA